MWSKHAVFFFLPDNRGSEPACAHLGYFNRVSAISIEAWICGSEANLHHQHENVIPARLHRKENKLITFRSFYQAMNVTKRNVQRGGLPDYWWWKFPCSMWELVVCDFFASIKCSGFTLGFICSACMAQIVSLAVSAQSAEEYRKYMC